MRFICPEIEGVDASTAIMSELTQYKEDNADSFQSVTGTWQKAVIIENKKRLTQNGFMNDASLTLQGGQDLDLDLQTATAWLSGQGITVSDASPTSASLFHFPIQHATELISPYWFTIYDEDGVTLRPSYYDGSYRGAVNEADILARNYSPLTLNYKGETGADFYIAANIDRVVPDLINSTLKGYAVNKARALQDVITFQSGGEFSAGDWVQYKTRQYQILSRRTMTQEGRTPLYAYSACLSSNDSITFQGADVKTYFGKVTLADGPQLDSFGRLRVSTPNTLFDNHNQYDKGNIMWNEYIVGTGSSTHRPHQSSVLLSTGGTAKYAGIVRQTKDFIRYYPGKSQLVELTGTLSTTAMDANTRSRIGQFDDFNGFFFENNGGTVYAVVRDFTGNQYTTTPDPFTALLHHCEAATGTDTSGIQTITSTNTVASSAQKKFGTNSLLMNGSSYTTYTIADDYFGAMDLETSDYTIDMWCYFPNTLTVGNTIWDMRTTSNTGAPYCYSDATASPNTKIVFAYGGSVRITSTNVIPVNTWFHFAMVKKDGVWTLYINGVSGGTYTDGVTPVNRYTQFRIGADYTGANYIKNLSYYDEVRILKSYAYWTAAFTAPTAAYSDVTRTYTETKVAQSSWNLDKLDGTGASGITLDPKKENIYMISYQALYAGRVIMALDIDGQIVPVHEFLNANAKTGPYISNVNLPLRYEIMNTGTASSTMTMLQTCVAVHSEGGQEDISDHSYHHAVSNGTTAVAVTTRRAILSIRPKNPFNSIMNRIHILPANILVFAKTNDCFVEVVYGGTLGGTPSWTSAGTNSGVEYDVAGTTVTGGEVVEAFHVAAGTGVAGGSTEGTIISWKYPIALGLHGQPGSVLSIVVTSLSGTSDVRGVINFEEIY